MRRFVVQSNWQFPKSRGQCRLRFPSVTRALHLCTIFFFADAESVEALMIGGASAFAWKKTPVRLAAWRHASSSQRHREAPLREDRRNQDTRPITGIRSSFFLTTPTICQVASLLNDAMHKRRLIISHESRRSQERGAQNSHSIDSCTRAPSELSKRFDENALFTGSPRFSQPVRLARRLAKVHDGFVD